MNIETLEIGRTAIKLQQARMEIEDDEASWDNEWELMWQDIEDLIEEYNNNKN